MNDQIKEGSPVNYHSIIGGQVTSTGHTVKRILKEPNNFGQDVAWITGKAGCVAIDALSINDQQQSPIEATQEAQA